MINHFKTEADAVSHLTSKGFTQRGRKWVSRCGLIDARVFIDNFRGVYIQFVA
jgi:Holliday junction resolvase-like predicted endonuclease